MIRRCLTNHTAWKSLPNIESFEIKLGSYNDFWLKQGVTKRENNEILTRPYLNSHSNRYMKYLLHRGNIMIEGGNLKEYTSHIMRLCISSTSFLPKVVAAWNKVYPKWHREKDLHTILHVNSRITEIFKTKDTNLLIKRMFITKANGKQRPLGVPSMKWRITGYMLNNFLYQGVKHLIDPHQHAYQPGKGCLTAWASIFQRRLLRYKYIYDVDLKGFFDNVMINQVFKQLLDTGFPTSFCTWLENIHRKLPQGIKNHGPDSQIWMKRDIENRIRKGLPWVADYFGTYQEMVKQYPHKSTPPLTPQELVREMSNWGCQSVEEYIQIQWAVSDSQEPSTILNMFQGFPQGFNTSPLLSILSLKSYCESQRDVNGEPLQWIAYADDIRFFSNAPFTIHDNPSLGIIHNEEKCGWIKVAGEWKAPFDWLGLRWDPNYQSTKTSTVKDNYSHQITHQPGALHGKHPKR